MKPLHYNDDENWLSIILVVLGTVPWYFILFSADDKISRTLTLFKFCRFFEILRI